MSFYDDANLITKEAADNALKSFSVVTKGFQTIAAENGEFAKRAYEQHTQLLEKLAQARSVEKVIEVQTEYGRTMYQTWMTQAQKLGELYSEIARETYKPFEKAATTAVVKGKEFTKKAVAEVDAKVAA